MSMSRFKGIFLLLACVLLLTIMGLAHAQGSSITVTTDKTTYSPGDTVRVTVTVTGPITGPGLTVEIVPVPMSSGLFPVAAGTLSVSGGTLALTLPNSTTPGHYDVGVVAEEGGTFTLDPAVGVTVTKLTPVPETPSALGLLLPAMLAVIIVLRKNRLR